jgi:hypothetical protein
MADQIILANEAKATATALRMRSPHPSCLLITLAYTILTHYEGAAYCI